MTVSEIVGVVILAVIACIVGITLIGIVGAFKVSLILGFLCLFVPPMGLANGLAWAIWSIDLAQQVSDKLGGLP